MRQQQDFAQASAGMTVTVAHVTNTVYWYS